jgi:hypothetical protein
MPKEKLSETQSEAEEARWFEENQERLLKLFEQAEKEGSLRVGGKSVGITLSKKTEALRKPPATGERCRGRLLLDALRGTADTCMSTDEIMAVTRGESRVTTRRRK